MNTVFLSTGGNLGNKKNNLQHAAEEIEKRIGHIEQRSCIYETAAWGITDQPSFYNQVLIVKTNLLAEEIMEILLQIEELMGRKRTIKNAARIIDIDILFFNDEIIQTNFVTIPHAEIANRRFVLAPLNEIAPEMIHPDLGKTMRELLEECKDKLAAKILEGEVWPS